MGLMESTFEKNCFSGLPQHVVIYCVLLPFLDVFSKLKLKTVSHDVKDAINENLATNDLVKKELQYLLKSRYDEDELYTHRLYQNTMLEKFREFFKVETNIIHLSQLWQFYSNKQQWVLTENPQNELKKTVRNFVTYESLFGRKFSFFSKNNGAGYEKYQIRWKAALETLIDLSQKETSLFDNEEKLKYLIDRLCLIIDSIDTLIPSAKAKQHPVYISNYRKGLLAFYHYLNALVTSPGGEQYLAEKTSGKTTRSLLP